MISKLCRDWFSCYFCNVSCAFFLSRVASLCIDIDNAAPNKAKAEVNGFTAPKVSPNVPRISIGIRANAKSMHQSPTQIDAATLIQPWRSISDDEIDVSTFKFFS